MIIHVSGNHEKYNDAIRQILLNKYENRVLILDLDDMYDEYRKNSDHHSSYQSYVNNFIVNSPKPLILLGPSANLYRDIDIFSLDITHKFYIKFTKIPLKQRLSKHISKLLGKKVWTDDHTKTHVEKGYCIMNANNVLENISMILDSHLRQSGGNNARYVFNSYYLMPK